MNIARKWLSVVMIIGLLVLAGDFGFYLLHSSSNLHLGTITDGDVVQATSMNLTDTHTSSAAVVGYTGYNNSEQQYYNSTSGLKSILVVSAKFSTTKQADFEYEHLRNINPASVTLSRNQSYNGFVYSYLHNASGAPKAKWSAWGISSNYVFYARGLNVPISNATIKALAMDQIDAMT